MLSKNTGCIRFGKILNSEKRSVNKGVPHSIAWIRSQSSSIHLLYFMTDLSNNNNKIKIAS